MKILKTMVGEFKLTEEEGAGAVEAMNRKGVFVSTRLGIAIQNHQMQAVLPYPPYPCDEVLWDSGVVMRRGNEYLGVSNSGEVHEVPISGNQIPIDEALIKKLLW